MNSNVHEVGVAGIHVFINVLLQLNMIAIIIFQIIYLEGKYFLICIEHSNYSF